MDEGPAGAAAGAEGEGVVGPTPVADEVAVGVAPRVQEADPRRVPASPETLPRPQGGIRLRFAGPSLLYGALQVRLQGGPLFFYRQKKILMEKR